jgi:3-oxoacyl-[acyl-carrier protein] reductase
MVAQKYGKIINISSVWGICGASCEAAYSASKGGVNALTRALAKELAPSGIQVNAIACGAIDTEMNQFLEPEEREALLEEIPACRMGTPQEVAEMVLRLTEAPSYLTGQIIQLDGGWI